MSQVLFFDHRPACRCAAEGENGDSEDEPAFLESAKARIHEREKTGAFFQFTQSGLSQLCKGGAIYLPATGRAVEAGFPPGLRVMRLVARSTV